MGPGDVLVVTKLDRVARSARDLLNIIIGELDGRGFVSLGDSWCDTTSAMGRFMLTMMSGIAELERDLIRKRCAAGIARAKANGKQFGRPKVLDTGQRKKIAERLANGETISALAREYGCGKATVWRAVAGQ
jgi:DNA invertase Pin-like site-specific DNA recombinase